MYCDVKALHLYIDYVFSCQRTQYITENLKCKYKIHILFLKIFYNKNKVKHQADPNDRQNDAGNIKLLS